MILCSGVEFSCSLFFSIYSDLATGLILFLVCSKFSKQLEKNLSRRALKKERLEKEMKTEEAGG